MKLEGPFNFAVQFLLYSQNVDQPKVIQRRNCGEICGKVQHPSPSRLLLENVLRERGRKQIFVEARRGDDGEASKKTPPKEQPPTTDANVPLEQTLNEKVKK